MVTSAIYLHSFNPCLMKCKLWEPSLYTFLKDGWVIFFKKHEKLDICYKFQTIYHLGILCCKDWWHQIITPSVTSARFSSLFLVNCYIKKMLSKIFFSSDILFKNFPNIACSVWCNDVKSVILQRCSHVVVWLTWKHHHFIFFPPREREK